MQTEGGVGAPVWAKAWKPEPAQWFEGTADLFVTKAEVLVRL